jgi:DNA-binding transcriptional ArsR family regulator
MIPINQPTMDAKHIARYLGAMSIEERVQIVRCLLEAGADGLQMLDIAAKTELGPSAVSKQIESLTGLEIIFVKSVDNNKVYFANTGLIDTLFDWMYQHFGPGFQAKMEAAQAAEIGKATTQAGS